MMNKDDLEYRNALAARGYWQAYQAVRQSIRKVLKGENPGAVSNDDHGDWYRETGYYAACFFSWASSF